MEPTVSTPTEVAGRQVATAWSVKALFAVSSCSTSSAVLSTSGQRSVSTQLVGTEAQRHLAGVAARAHAHGVDGSTRPSDEPGRVGERLTGRRSDEQQRRTGRAQRRLRLARQPLRREHDDEVGVGAVAQVQARALQGERRASSCPRGTPMQTRPTRAVEVTRRA